MHIEGRLYICDKCKKEQFKKDDNACFNTPPQGWSYKTTPIQDNCVLLCEKCLEEYLNLVKNFMEESQGE